MRRGTRLPQGASMIRAACETIASVEPVNFVLELNAGVTAGLGIGPGSRLTFSSG